MRSFLQFLNEETNPVSVDAYHGSGKKFSAFSQQHARIPNDHFGGGVGYFTDSNSVGRSYAKSMAKKTGTPHLYHTSLNMKNVFDVDHEFTGNKLTHVIPKDVDKFARGAGLLRLDNAHEKHKVLSDISTGQAKLTGHQVFKGLSNGMNDTAKARDHLISKGYDGLRYNGGMMVPGAPRHNVYIPYNAGSIKIKKVEKLG